MKKAKTTIKRVLSCVLALVMILSYTPDIAFAEDTMSDEFKANLNEDGKFEMHSIVPKSEEDMIQLFWENETMSEKYPDLWFDEFSEDYKSCVLTDYALEESHEVEIEYIYDEEMVDAVADIIDLIPKGEYDEELDQYDPYPFEVKDMELINYWVNGGGINDLISYSGEFKELIGYKNFRIDCRRGDDAPFYTEAYGFAPFSNNGTIYGFADMGVKAKHVVFVPDETGDTPEALKEAVLKRIEEYIGAGKVEVEIVSGGDTPLDIMLSGYDETIAYIQEQVDDYEGYITDCESQIAQCIANIEQFTADRDSDPAYYDALIAQEQEFKLNCENNLASYEESLAQTEAWLDNAKEAKQEYIDEYNTEGGENYYLKEAAGNCYFTFKIGEEEYSVVVVKDSDRMVTPEYKSADVKTGITVDSTDASIPLDTLISVEELASGDVYEEIMSVLDVENSKSFDINLFSSSLDEYITKLENGEFKVRIPIGAEYDGKDLIVYYVDENKEVHPYTVFKDGDYAVFATDHFSVYTLAVVETADDSNDEDDSNSGDNSGNDDSSDSTGGATTPDTGDNVNVGMIYMMLMMSAVVICFVRAKRRSTI